MKTMTVGATIATGVALLVWHIDWGEGDGTAPAHMSAQATALQAIARPAPILQPLVLVPPALPVTTLALPGTGAGLRVLFERGLMRLAERPLALIRLDVDSELAERLPAAQRPAALALLDKYAHFRAESAQLSHAIETAASPQALRAHLDALQALRARTFDGPEVATLFPDEGAYEALLLARREIAYDATLDDETKHQRLQDLESSVSPALQSVESARSGIVLMEAR